MGLKTLCLELSGYSYERECQQIKLRIITPTALSPLWCQYTSSAGRKESLVRNKWMRGSWTWIWKGQGSGHISISSFPIFLLSSSEAAFDMGVRGQKNNAEGGVCFLYEKQQNRKEQQSGLRQRAWGVTLLWPMRKRIKWGSGVPPAQHIKVKEQIGVQGITKTITKGKKKSQVAWLVLSGTVRYWQKRIKEVTESPEASKQDMHIKLKGRTAFKSVVLITNLPLQLTYKPTQIYLSESRRVIRSQHLSIIQFCPPLWGFIFRVHVVARWPPAALRL